MAAEYAFIFTTALVTNFLTNAYMIPRLFIRIVTALQMIALPSLFLLERVYDITSGTHVCRGLVGEAIQANLTDNSFIYGGTLDGLILFNHYNALDIKFG